MSGVQSLRFLDEKSKEVLRVAEGIVLEAGSDAGGVEHLLAALAMVRGTRAKLAFEQVGVGPEALRSASIRLSHGSLSPRGSRETIPITPELKEVLEVSQALVEEPRNEGAVTPAHLLGAILKQANSKALRALEEVGIDPESLKSALGSE